MLLKPRVNGIFYTVFPDQPLALPTASATSAAPSFVVPPVVPKPQKLVRPPWHEINYHYQKLLTYGYKNSNNIKGRRKV